MCLLCVSFVRFACVGGKLDVYLYLSVGWEKVRDERGVEGMDSV